MSKVIRALVLLVALSEAHGQVTITGVVRTPTGEPWEGELRIQSQMMICGGIIYPPTTQRIQISGGMLNVSVQPTDVCGSGNSYKVYYMRAGKTEHTAYWVVPSTPPTTTVDAVQTSVVPTTQLLLPLSQLGTPGPAGSVIISTGTGWVAGSVLTDPTSATGDLIYRGPAGTLTRLPLGSSGQVLSSDGSVPAWTVPPGSVWGSITGTLSDQADLQSALDAKAGTVHVHDAGDIASGTMAAARLGGGTPTSSTFLRGDSIWAGVDWASITGKPSVFPPSSHNHLLADLGQSGAATGQVPKWNGSAWVPASDDTGVSPSWGSITGTLSNQTDLQSVLDSKASTSHTHTASDTASGVFAPQRLGTGTPTSSTFLRGDSIWAGVDWASIVSKPNTFPPDSHTHPLSELSQSGATAGQIPKWNGGEWVPAADDTGGLPSWGNITGTLSNQTDLWGELSGKAAVSHTHSSGDLNQSGATSNQALVWSGAAWIPANVANSVFGRTGAVTAQSGDYASGQVSHTPGGNIAATNVQDAIAELDNEKAAAIHTHSGADITSGTVATARLGNGTASSSTFLRGDQTWNFVGWNDVSGKPSAFPPSSHTHAASDTTSGVFAPQRLGTGTPSNANYLRGDGVWAALPPLNSNMYVQMPAASCMLFGASTTLTLFGPAYPGPTCRVGGNVVSAVLDFYDTDSLTVQGSIVLAGTFSAVNLVLTWDTQATTGDVVWQVQTACVADGETGDPSWNAAQTIVDAAQTTAGARNQAALNNVTVTGCAAGDTMYWKLTRDPAHASDTIAETASLHHLLWEVVR